MDLSTFYEIWSVSSVWKYHGFGNGSQILLDLLFFIYETGALTDNIIVVVVYNTDYMEATTFCICITFKVNRDPREPTRPSVGSTCPASSHIEITLVGEEQTYSGRSGETEK